MTAENPLHERASGILLHPTSLPGAFGVGDLGPEAHRFLGFLSRAGQRWWQMLPVNPPGGGASPYDSPSAFAGSPLLVSLEHLVRDGLLDASALRVHPRLANSRRASYAAARRLREGCLRRAFETFEDAASTEERQRLAGFCAEQSDWLEDYALFSALKRESGAVVPWTRWDPALVQRTPAALAKVQKRLEDEIRYHCFVQYRFAKDFSELRDHARARGIRLMGDMPMFAAHDGADVWQNQRFFQLHPNGERRVVAGVPPDYFSADGQLWGNPLYDWQALAQDGFSFWIRRLKRTLERFDAVRLDHFIGFHRYWEIPADAKSARDGHFVLVPGTEFFEKARAALGALPFVAEDLGIVTTEVTALRERFGFPGMRVLVFAFAGEWREYQPHRFSKQTVVYTGTHDNDTLMGWLSAHERATDPGTKHHLLVERERALRYAGSDGREPHWDMLRLLLSSVADTALFPIQDLLGLGSEARMNVPGVAMGNWTFRLVQGSLKPELADRLAELSDAYERIPPGFRRHE